MNNEEHGIRKVMVSSAVLDDIVSFTGAIEYFCVGLVDIVNSTNITSRLSDEKSCLYYSIFLNTMAVIVKRFGGIVVKKSEIAFCITFQKHLILATSKLSER